MQCRSVEGPKYANLYVSLFQRYKGKGNVKAHNDIYIFIEYFQKCLQILEEGVCLEIQHLIITQSSRALPLMTTGEHSSVEPFNFSPYSEKNPNPKRYIAASILYLYSLLCHLKWNKVFQQPLVIMLFLLHYKNNQLLH